MGPSGSCEVKRTAVCVLAIVKLEAVVATVVVVVGLKIRDVAVGVITTVVMAPNVLVVVEDFVLVITLVDVE